MTDPPPVGQGARLDFNAPLSAARADRFVRDLAERSPRQVIDFGCGWGELLLRILRAAPRAAGTGVDTHGPDIERAQSAANARGLGRRATFVTGPAQELPGTADLVINIGAYHAFGAIPTALAELRQRLNPGGVLLFGAEFWEHPPPPDRLARMWDGITADDLMFLPDVVDSAVEAGFRPLRIETVTRGEWEDYESGLAADGEDWLLANPGDPEAEELRNRLDAQRAIWLRGHRDLFGFAYLTLGVPVTR
jgi:SAM-dependent methyltransferase